jgi:uncharacterized protein (DUF1800 family)
MQSLRLKFAAIFALGAGLLVSSELALGKKDKPSSTFQMDARKRALHAINRLTFGPRPGELERVMAMGVDKWIDQQLHPDKLDNSAIETRLAPLRTLRMNTRELAENFPPPQMVKAVAEGKQPMPHDATQRAIYRAQMARYEAKKEAKEAASAEAPTDGKQSPETMNNAERMRRRAQRVEGDRRALELLDLPPDQRVKEILHMSPEEQRTLSLALKGKQDQFMKDLDPKQREMLVALNNPQQVVATELVQGKLLRAIYSEHQLEELMTDFWFNHFNVFMGKGADRYFLTSYERDVIRPHALGKFEDLLVATAQSPAMLFYLDNWLSVGPNSEVALGMPKHPDARGRVRPRLRPQPKRKRGGLNENYGRELMELHSLGVNGGYTQKDVTEVARVFTGWTLKEPRKGGGFIFEERMHEPGDKVILGHRIKGKGEKEGRELLHILGHHPSTARFICGKIAMRFVSDNPPQPLIDRMAQTFLKQDGNIAQVLKTMLDSPEFWSQDTYRAKVKTPLEFVVSAVRATGSDVGDALPLTRQLQSMGMPLYGSQPPTGYPMKAEAWVNSSALLGRMNFALALAAGQVNGVRVDSGQLLVAGPEWAEPQQALMRLENDLLAGDVSKQTHETISARLEDPKINGHRFDDPARPPNAAIITGLLLGSPEFQRK